ncbi:hypothetical protein GCM10010446_64060 [Streptomyces enissocaesilis]|uniref:Uncharacterized protein n=1 Tax=Streptomyces enissocaesilis TaxID=332589 RepID=A0ABP6K7Y5_9ACTN
MHGLAPQRFLEAVGVAAMPAVRWVTTSVPVSGPRMWRCTTAVPARAASTAERALLGGDRQVRALADGVSGAGEGAGEGGFLIGAVGGGYGRGPAQLRWAGADRVTST